MFNFFQKPFGLDISDFSIKIISLSGTIENPCLLALARTELPLGIFEDGKIFEKKELTKFLKKLILEPSFCQIKTRKFIFSLPESKSFTHIFNLPEGLKKEEISEFIKSQAVQIFPFNLAEIYLDFQIRNNEVLLVAAPKKIVNDYLEIFKKCQIRLLALEVESLSLGRALIRERGVILIADIGARMTNLSLFDEGELKLSISTPIAGNKFTQLISEKLKLLPSDAEKIKREIGLNPEERGGRIFLILQEAIQVLITDIRKIDDFFQKKTGRSIEKIILAGGSAKLPYLSEYLAENLEKEVKIADPWFKINTDILKTEEHFKEALEIEPILYSTVIGSALRGLEKNPKEVGINLLKELKFQS